MEIRRREDVLILLGAFVFYLALGAYIIQSRQYLPYDSLARLVSAWLVLEGTEVKLASIGFVWPPIPTLVLIPWMVFSELVRNWLALVIVSAGFMAVACVAVNHLASICGLRRVLRLLVVLLFAINPLVIVFAINGMSEAISISFVLAGSYWLVRFWQTDRGSHLIVAGFFFGILPLVRYELALLTLASGIVVLLLCWRRRPLLGDADFREFLEGRLLAYSSLVIYPIFLWAVASWFVMGHPLYFLFNDRSAISLAEAQISGYSSLIITPFRSFRLIFGVWTSAYAAWLIATFLALIIGFYRRILFLVGMALLALILPVAQWILLIQRAYVPLLRYFIMAVPLGLILSMIVFGYLQSRSSQNRRWRAVLPTALTLLLLISNLGSWWVLEHYEYQNIENETWIALTSADSIENRNFNESFAIGKLLLEVIPPGSRVLIDTYEFGYAIILGAGTHDIFMDFTDPDYEAAVANPSAYVDYLIVPRPQERGVFYSINMAHKHLHSDGATWAELVDALPQTNLEWRLFKVR